VTAGNGVLGPASNGRKANPSLRGPEKAAILRALGFSDAEVCLHSLLLRPIDDEILASALGGLPAALVGALLAYLRKWVDRLLLHSDIVTEQWPGEAQ